MTSTTAADGADEVGRYPRGRVPRAVRLRHVLGLAEELFVERGYQQASMDELARRADVSKPVVYDLVGSKEQLFGTLMDRWADDLSARVSVAVVGEPDPAQRLRAGARAFFGFVGEHRAAWWALLSGDGAPVTAAFAAARERQAQVVARLVEQGARDSGEPVAPVQRRGGRPCPQRVVRGAGTMVGVASRPARRRAGRPARRPRGSRPPTISTANIDRIPVGSGTQNRRRRGQRAQVRWWERSPIRSMAKRRSTKCQPPVDGTSAKVSV